MFRKYEYYIQLFVIELYLIYPYNRGNIKFLH
jgi:hypothetical protein